MIPNKITKVINYHHLLVSDPGLNLVQVLVELQDILGFLQSSA